MPEFSVEPREDVISKVHIFLERLHAAGLAVESADIYGSFAEGSATPDNDVDVAIVSTDLTGNRLDDWMRLNRISSSIDVRMEVIGYRPEQFRDEHPLARK